MARFFLSDLKATLNNCIAELEEIHFMFCKNPESDFTRNCKLSFHDYIQLMLQMQSKSVSNEILDFYEHSLSAPSKSAFTQQRYKLQTEGLLSMKEKKVIMQSTSMRFMTSSIRPTAIFLCREKRSFMSVLHLIQ